MLGQPQFVPRMSSQRIMDHKLARDLQRDLRIDAPAAIDGGQFAGLGLRIGIQLGALTRQIGGLGIGLRADRNILARRHRHGPGDESRDARDEDPCLAGLGGGNANDQTGGRHQSIIGPQHCGAQPSDPGDQMAFGMAFKSAHV